MQQVLTHGVYIPAGAITMPGQTDPATQPIVRGAETGGLELSPADGGEGADGSPSPAPPPAAPPGGSVGQPGFWEGLIPIWVSGRAAYDYYQNSDYGWALLHGALAATDVIPVRAAATAGVKLGGKVGVKLGGFATRKAVGLLCFFAGTPVATENGTKPIERVGRGERVWSCDLGDGNWKLCRVAEMFELRHVGPRISTVFSGEKIDSTDHHPFWVVSGDDLEGRQVPITWRRRRCRIVTSRAGGSTPVTSEWVTCCCRGTDNVLRLTIYG